MPPTLVASIYGQNFARMPFLHIVQIDPEKLVNRSLLEKIKAAAYFDSSVFVVKKFNFGHIS
jgi:hypothetical protein